MYDVCGNIETMLNQFGNTELASKLNYCVKDCSVQDGRVKKVSQTKLNQYTKLNYCVEE